MHIPDDKPIIVEASAPKSLNNSSSQQAYGGALPKSV